jgi:hypothetical protein
MSSYSDDDFEALATGRGVLKPALGDLRSRFEEDGRENLPLSSPYVCPSSFPHLAQSRRNANHLK